MSIPATGGRFRLTVLKKDWLHLLSHKNTVDDTWPVLSQIDLADAALTITEGDIDTYNWSSQMITLTSQASERFLPGFASAAPSQGLQYTLFVVSLNGVRLYGGMFMSEGSAMAIDFPVIYLGQIGSRIVLGVRASNTGMNNYPSLSTSERGRIEIPAVRNYFERLGKLLALPRFDGHLRSAEQAEKGCSSWWSWNSRDDHEGRSPTSTRRRSSSSAGAAASRSVPFAATSI